MKSYYVLSNGRLRRKDNTLFIENAETGQKKPVPIEDVDSLYVYGEVDLNTRLLNFLSQKRITLHVFNYYGFYAGSYYPREYLHSGHLVVRQSSHYSDPEKRLAVAREFVEGAAHSLVRNIAYYSRRREGPEPPGEIGCPEQESGAGSEGTGAATERGGDLAGGGTPTDAAMEAGVDASLDLEWLGEEDPLASTADFSQEPAPLTDLRATIEGLRSQIPKHTEINALRGIEGKMRERYYAAWRHILADGWVFHRRVRRPPDNEVNALISFGNGVLYTACLGEIYRTQLTPTISYLHEPGARRFSLALDLSEIFKPLVVDRTIFKLINNRQLQPEHFAVEMEGAYLTDAGKKLFLTGLEERFSSTIRHRRLGRNVSYRHLIRLECYKLIRHLTDVEPYHAFRAWW